MNSAPFASEMVFANDSAVKTRVFETPGADFLEVFRAHRRKQPVGNLGGRPAVFVRDGLRGDDGCEKRCKNQRR
jgi:hypothetical protein